MLNVIVININFTVSYYAVIMLNAFKSVKYNDSMTHYTQIYASIIGGSLYVASYTCIIHTLILVMFEYGANCPLKSGYLIIRIICLLQGAHNTEEPRPVNV